MEKSKVYYTDFRAKLGEGLPLKLQRLIRTAGIDQIDMEGKFVAIKMHFGELGNLGFLRPNYARAVADVVKSLGGKPFLTDYNTDVYKRQPGGCPGPPVPPLPGTVPSVPGPSCRGWLFPPGCHPASG